MFNLIKNPTFQKILLLGLLFRLLIMPFFYHPDIKTYHFQASFLQNGVWDIYSYLDQQKESLPLKEEFVYFPLTYFTLGSYQYLISPLLGSNFDDWLFDASSSSVSNPEIFKYLFLLKLPYLLIDIVIAFLMASFFEGMVQKKRAFTLWLLNPFSIYIIYVFSNVDIFIVLASVLSLYLARKKRFLLSAITLGIGMGFKAYPLFFLPILFLYANSLKNRLLVVVGGIGTTLLIVAPFMLSKSFQKDALLSGLTTRILIPKIDIGFGEAIVVPVLFVTIFLAFLSLRKRLLMTDLIAGFTSILLLIFSFIHFHIQWLLWIMPFGVLLAVKKPRLIGLLVVLILSGVLIPMLYNDKYMNVALLNAVSPVFGQLPALFSVVQKVYDPVVLQGLLHTVFAGLSLYLIYAFYTEKDEA